MAALFCLEFAAKRAGPKADVVVEVRYAAELLREMREECFPDGFRQVEKTATVFHCGGRDAGHDALGLAHSVVACREVNAHLIEAWVDGRV